MEIDLIKALRKIRRRDGTPEFQGTDEEAVNLLAQAGLSPRRESDAFVNRGWELKQKLQETPEFANFSLASALLMAAEEQDPEIKAKQIWLKANTRYEDGVIAIQLFLQAAKRQKAAGGL